MASFITTQVLTTNPASSQQSEPLLQTQLDATLKIQHTWRQHADNWLILPSQLSSILHREIDSSSPYFPVTQDMPLIKRICHSANKKIQLLKGLKISAEIIMFREIQASHQLTVQASCASPPLLPPLLHLQIIDNSQIIAEGGYKELRKSVTVLVLFLKKPDTDQKSYVVIQTVDMQSKVLPNLEKVVSRDALRTARTAQHVYSFLKTCLGNDLELHHIAPPFLSITFSCKNHALVCHLEQKRFDNPCLGSVIKNGAITINQNKIALTPSIALSLALKIVEGLMNFHAIGLMHGDVKPHNVLIREDGEPLLTDFADYGSNFFHKWCCIRSASNTDYPFWSLAKVAGFETPFDDIYGAVMTLGFMCLRVGFKSSMMRREIASYDEVSDTSVCSSQYYKLQCDILIDYLFKTLDNLREKQQLSAVEIDNFLNQLYPIWYKHQLSHSLSDSEQIYNFAKHLYAHLKGANTPDIPPILQDIDTLVLVHELVGEVAICDFNRFLLLQNPSLQEHLTKEQLNATDVWPFYNETFKITLKDIHKRLALQIQRYQNL